MEHPKPLEKAIDILKEMDKESFLYMLNHKNPIPLVSLAKQHGFTVLSHEYSIDQWHILISRCEESILQGYLDV